MSESEKIEEFLQLKDKVTLGEVARGALHLVIPLIGAADQRYIAAVMERLGWRRGRDANGRWWGSGVPGSWWVHPAKRHARERREFEERKARALARVHAEREAP